MSLIEVHWTGEGILYRINRRFVNEGNQFRLLTQEEHDGVPSLFPPETHRFVWLKPVDHVFMGSSLITCRREYESVPEDMPLGDYFHKYVAEEQPKSILFFASAWGPPPTPFIERVKNAYSKITWYFPPLPDMFRDINMDHVLAYLVSNLMDEGLLGPEDVARAPLSRNETW